MPGSPIFRGRNSELPTEEEEGEGEGFYLKINYKNLKDSKDYTSIAMEEEYIYLQLKFTAPKFDKPKPEKEIITTQG